MILLSALILSGAADLACERTTSSYSGSQTAPTVKVDAISPAIASANTSVTLQFSADQTVLTCKASFGSQATTCAAPSGKTCTCTTQVTASTPEGSVTVQVSASSDSGEGTASATAQVDTEGPIVTPALAAIVRTGSGAPDAVHLSVGAVTDPPPSYAGQAVTSITLWSSESGGSAIAQVTSGTNAELTIPFGTATQSFPELWVSAVDAAGNQGARAALSVGVDTTPPIIDPTQLFLDVEPAGTSDALAGNQNALTDDNHAVVSVRVSVDSASVNVIASPNVAADGSFASSPLGDQDLDRVYVTATDKAGNTSAAAYPRNVHARLNLQGRRRFDQTPPTLAAYTESWSDSILNPPAPGEAELVALEVSEADSTKAAALDGVLLQNARPPPYSQPSSTWTAAAATPPPRTEGTLAYDLGRSRAVLFGGADANTNQLLNDTREFDGTSWHTISTTHAPSPRTGARMAFDAGLGQVVLFGGQASTANPGTCSTATGYCNDTWLYDGTDWTPLVTAHAPPARSRHSFAYDPFHDQIVLFGGQSDSSNCGGASPSLFLCNDTWVFDGSDWQAVAVATAPSPRFDANAAYDGLATGVVIVGGLDNINDHQCEGSYEEYCQGVWFFNGETWILTFEFPGAADVTLAGEYGLAYDPLQEKIVLYYSNNDTCTSESNLAFACSASEGGSDGADTLLVYEAAKRAMLNVQNLSGTTVVDTLASPSVDSFFEGQVFAATIDPTAIVAHMQAAYAGNAGSGNPPSTFCDLQFNFWNYYEHLWESPGDNLVCGLGTATFDPSTLSQPVVANYVSNGKIWMLAADLGSNGTRSTFTDYVEVVVDYVLP